MTWLEIARGWQRIVVVLALVVTVCIMALMGAEWAQEALKGTMSMVIGFLFGERARSKADG